MNPIAYQVQMRKTHIRIKLEKKWELEEEEICCGGTLFPLALCFRTFCLQFGDLFIKSLDRLGEPLSHKLQVGRLFFFGWGITPKHPRMWESVCPSKTSWFTHFLFHLVVSSISFLPFQALR